MSVHTHSRTVELHRPFQKAIMQPWHKEARVVSGDLSFTVSSGDIWHDTQWEYDLLVVAVDADEILVDIEEDMDGYGYGKWESMIRSGQIVPVRVGGVRT